MDWSKWLDGDVEAAPVEFADIGCGYGGLLMRLSPMYPHVSMVGMEIRVKVGSSSLGISWHVLTELF